MDITGHCVIGEWVEDGKTEWDLLSHGLSREDAHKVCLKIVSNPSPDWNGMEHNERVVTAKTVLDRIALDEEKEKESSL